MKLIGNDTVAAIATPVGEGAISIVRVSGADAISLADSVFEGRSGLSEAHGYTVHHGKLIRKDGSLVDEVLVTVFREPYSFTGENSVEISCHGGMLVTAKVLETLLAGGARQAEPGEFTKRAFLNGKMDLSRAEAVADLIASKSQRAIRASLEQLEGKLADQVGIMKAEIVNLCSLLELELDFSEEGIALVPGNEILHRITTVRGRIEELIRSYELGRISREGVSVVILGGPNVGKSSVFNSLLQNDRAIVSPVPGTTRDSIEESISINGILFRLSDTAGLRESGDMVEMDGITRTKSRAAKSDLAIVVVDVADRSDRIGIEQIKKVVAHEKVLVAYNKIDLLNGDMDCFKRIGLSESDASVWVSAKTGAGMDSLRDGLAKLVMGTSSGNDDGVTITNLRHRNALARANDFLCNAHSAVQKGENGEIIAFELREAIGAISEITGEVTTDDILNNIFEKFCIGK